MNGADALLATLEYNGITTCFANPGTSEMHFVAALQGTAHMRGVLGLFEGVVTGAADGYARMTDQPAATLLHLGPGLANGLSNLHNAIRAHSPVVNVIGDHASYHRELDAPLTSDIEGAARPFSHWVRTSSGAEALAGDVADAVTVARRGQISSLILPADAAWNPVSAPPSGWPTGQPTPHPQVDTPAVQAAAGALRTGRKRVAILLGGRTVREDSVLWAQRIAHATGATVLSDTFTARVPRGAGRATTHKIPYPIQLSQPFLAQFDTFILVGTKPPVAFFAYPDKPSRLTAPGTRFVTLCPNTPFAAESLAALGEELDVTTDLATSTAPGLLAPLDLPQLPSGALTGEKIGAIIAHCTPEHAIVVDESLTTGGTFFADTATARPHDLLSGTGGSIGFAMPVAAGAAVACPDRPVLCLESDGSGGYMPQALWTHSREGLNITTLIFANRKYQILRNEMDNVGVEEVGERSAQLLDIDNPTISWCQLAAGFGVRGTRVETAEELAQALKAELAEPGPGLIEVVLP